MAAGPGAKRLHDWAFVHDHTADDGGVHSLLIRRADGGDLAFYRCWTPHPGPIAILIRVASRRWMIEKMFRTAKTPVGLDYYRCRTWTA